MSRPFGQWWTTTATRWGATSALVGIASAFLACQTDRSVVAPPEKVINVLRGETSEGEDAAKARQERTAPLEDNGARFWLSICAAPASELCRRHELDPRLVATGYVAEFGSVSYRVVKMEPAFWGMGSAMRLVERRILSESIRQRSFTIYEALPAHKSATRTAGFELFVEGLGNPTDGPLFGGVHDRAARTLRRQALDAWITARAEAATETAFVALFAQTEEGVADRKWVVSAVDAAKDAPQAMAAAHLDLARARLAFLDRDFPRVLTLCQLALDKAPALPFAHLLLANAHLLMENEVRAALTATDRVQALQETGATRTLTDDEGRDLVANLALTVDAINATATEVDAKLIEQGLSAIAELLSYDNTDERRAQLTAIQARLAAQLVAAEEEWERATATERGQGG